MLVKSLIKLRLRGTRDGAKPNPDEPRVSPNLTLLAALALGAVLCGSVAAVNLTLAQSPAPLPYPVPKPDLSSTAPDAAAEPGKPRSKKAAAAIKVPAEVIEGLIAGTPPVPPTPANAPDVDWAVMTPQVCGLSIFRFGLSG